MLLERTREIGLGAVSSAIAAVVLLGAADWCGLLQWPPHYIAGSDEQWPLDLATTAWLTACAVSAPGWWRDRMRRSTACTLAAVVGAGLAGVLWVHVRAVPPAGVSVVGAEAKVALAALLGGVLMTVGRYASIRLGIALPVFIVGAAAVYSAASPWTLWSSMRPGELPWSTYADTQRLSLWVTSGAAVLLAAALTAWCLRCHDPGVIAMLGPVVGVGLLVIMFYLVGFDPAPDHNMTIDSLHRARTWLVCTLAGSAGAVLMRMAFTHRSHQKAAVT